MFDLTGVGADPGSFGRRDRGQFNVLGDEPAQHVIQVGQHLVHLDDLRFHELLPTERQELTSQVGPAPARLENGLGLAMK